MQQGLRRRGYAMIMQGYVGFGVTTPTRIKASRIEKTMDTAMGTGIVLG